MATVDMSAPDYNTAEAPHGHRRCRIALSEKGEPYRFYPGDVLPQGFTIVTADDRKYYSKRGIPLRLYMSIRRISDYFPTSRAAKYGFELNFKKPLWKKLLRSDRINDFKRTVNLYKRFGIEVKPYTGIDGSMDWDNEVSIYLMAGDWHPQCAPTTSKLFSGKQGAYSILHFDKKGKFVGQEFGSEPTHDKYLTEEGMRLEKS